MSFCVDCGLKPATVFLPEGRYLCDGCWGSLRELRQLVHQDTARRMRERTKRLAREDRRAIQRVIDTRRKD